MKGLKGFTFMLNGSQIMRTFSRGNFIALLVPLKGFYIFEN